MSVSVNPQLWKKLKERYTEKGLVLALGAGVSQTSGLLSWDELIEGLGKKVDERGKPRIVPTLRAAGYGLPAIVSVIEEAYKRKGKDEDFGEAIQEILYGRFRFGKETDLEDEKTRRTFIRHVGQNKTLRAVAALCAVSDGKGYKRNPRLHAIVTTNVDSVLRTYIHARFPPAPSQEHNLVRTIERPSAGRVYDSIPIYYLHGLIRFDKDVDETHKHAADLRVFTEQEFFDFFNNPNGLFSYTFLYLLREFSCVFLGMSLRDDNIRRLLHYSRKERSESKRYELRRLVSDQPAEGEGATRYLERLARRLEVNKEEIPAHKGERAQYIEGRIARLADDDSRRHFFIDRHPRVKYGPKKGERLAELTEVSLERLGVNVLWLDDFSQVSRRFKELYESPEGRRGSWADVYNMKYA